MISKAGSKQEGRRDGRSASCGCVIRRLVSVAGSVLLVQFLVMGAATVHAAEDAKSARAEQLMRENMEAFHEWRASIPDYEKRLYDRVKDINQRVLRNTRLIGLGSAVMIALLGFIAWKLVRAAHLAYTIPGRPSVDSAEGMDGAEAARLARRYERVAEQQKRLLRLLEHLEALTQAQGEEVAAFMRERADFDAVLKECRELHSRIDEDLSRAGDG